MKNIEGKVVVIVGATGDIGGELAVNFSNRKARVVAVGRDLDKLLNLVRRSGVARIIPFRADCSRMEDVSAILGEFEKVDLLITSVGSWQEIGKDETPDKFGAQLDLDFDSVAKAAINPIYRLNQYFLESKEGHIVDISSHAAEDTSLLGDLTYGPAKTAVKAFIELLRSENGRNSGVVISRIVAQLVDTPKNRIKYQHTEEEWGTAVQISKIADWIVANLNNPNAEKDPFFAGKLKV